MASAAGAGLLPSSFNRTIVELKHDHLRANNVSIPAFNRTIVELKPRNP